MMRLFYYGLLLAIFASCQTADTGDDSFAPLPNQANQDVERQIQFITDQIANNTNEPNFYLERAKLYCQLNRFRTAMSDLDVVAGLQGESSELLYWRAFALMGLKDYANALRNVQQASKERDNIETNMLLGELLYLNGNSNEAFYYIEKSYQILTENPKMAYYKGMIMFERQDSATAIKELKKAISLAPKYEEPYLGLIDLSLHYQQPIRALLYAQNAINQGLANEHLYFLVGQGLDQKEEIDSASQFYMKALQLQPAAWEASYALAKYHIKKKNYLQAERYYKEALSYNPNIDGGYYQIGFMYEYYLGQLDNALLSYRKGYNLQRSNEELAKAIARVERKILRPTIIIPRADSLGTITN